MLIRKNILNLVFAGSLICASASAANSDSTKDNKWILGEGKISTAKGFLRKAGSRAWWYRKHPEKIDSVQIKTDGEHLFDEDYYGEQLLLNYAELACSHINSTTLAAILTVPKRRFGTVMYNTDIISIACVPEIEYAEIKSAEREIEIERERNLAI